MKIEQYFDEVYKYFGENFYEKNGYPIVSKISNDLAEHSSLEGHEHNCIGCNLSNSISQIYLFLGTVSNGFEKEYTHKIFFYLSYLLVEQMQFIYSLFEKRGFLRDNDVFSSKYSYCMQMKRWTNFFKHPKYFVLVHHPIYTFKKDDDYIELTENLKNSILIDSDFVKRFYRGEGNKEILFKQIANKRNVIVEFPDLLYLVKGFCNDIKRFVSNITEDDNYMKILNEEATFENFYPLLDEEE